MVKVIRRVNGRIWYYNEYAQLVPYSASAKVFDGTHPAYEFITTHKLHHTSLLTQAGTMPLPTKIKDLLRQSVK